jgi:hypothetical protein
MRDLEQNILSMLALELRRFTPALKKSGYSYGAPEIEIWREDVSSYTSEIRLTFLKDGQIDDVLEFHIYRDGKPVVTISEAVDWYRAELGKLTRCVRP